MLLGSEAVVFTVSTANEVFIVIYGSSVMCKKVVLIGFWHFNALRPSFKVHVSATPNEVDRESLQKRSWRHVRSKRHVRNHGILLIQVTVASVVVRNFPRQKTNKLKLAKQCSRQASKIKTKSFEIFLKWRHSSPIFHYAVNFIGRGQSGKFKAWFYGKKHRNSLFGVWTHS